MNFFLDRLLWNSEGGGGGGGEAAAAAPGAAAASSPAAAASAAAPSAADAAAAGGGAAASSAAEIYKPSGLADHYLGASNNETIDKLAKAVEGYRTRDAANQVPEKVEGYSDFGADIPPEIAPHLETLKADPLYGRMAQFALDQKMSAPAYQGLVKQFLAVSGEMGLLEPPVDVKAERQALVPDTARHLPEAEQKVAIEKRMTENFAFVDAMVARGADKGGISKEVGEFAKAMLGDTARGHQFIEFVKSIGGGKQQIYSGGGSPNEGDPKEALRARGRLPENTVGHKDFNRASYDQLQADYKKVYGD